MHPHAEIVRSVLNWSLRVVRGHEACGEELPGPRLAQISLGQLMCRTEIETIDAIAREIQKTGESLDSIVACIRSAWGQEESVRHRTGHEDSVLVASRLVSALRRFGRERDRDTIELACSLRTWKACEQVMPGRDWQSIRDDFESLARKFYAKESAAILDTVEYISKIVALSRRSA